MASLWTVTRRQSDVICVTLPRFGLNAD